MKNEIEINESVNEYFANRKRILVYVCPDCNSLRIAGSKVGMVCRKAKLHINNEKVVSMKLGELFVKMEVE